MSKSTYGELEKRILELESKIIELQPTESLRATEQLLLEKLKGQFFFFTRDAEGEVTYVSTTVTNVLGYSRQEFVKGLQGLLTDNPVNNNLAKKVALALKGKRLAPYEVEIKHQNGGTVWLELEELPLANNHGKVEAIETVALDITERKQAGIRLYDSMGKLRLALAGIIEAMALIVETRDPYTAGHQRRTTAFARAVAQEMGLTSAQIDGIRMAGVIHDLGKVSVPAEILSKPGKIHNLEFDLVKVHPNAAYDILKEIEFPWPIARIILQHHERMNGSGYPFGVTGEKILLEARVLGVADVVEAMASHRPYRPAHPVNDVLNEIIKNRGILYDEDVVDASERVLRKGDFDFG